jgi:hypothetical protein
MGEGPTRRVNVVAIFSWAVKIAARHTGIVSKNAYEKEIVQLLVK